MPANAFAVLFGHATASQVLAVHQAFKQLADFAISGPTFPLFLGACYQLMGTPVEMTNWATPVAVQCFLSAGTAAMLYLIGTIAWNRKVGICGGVLAAIYQLLFVNSGRLYPETFAAFLLVSVALLTVRGLTGNDNSKSAPYEAFVLGIALACLQLTRSIMAILTIALLPITFFQQKSDKRFLVTAALVLGFVIALAPWMAFQKLAFGKAFRSC